MRKDKKFGVIDVGGGLRGIYGSGVFDYCLDNGICFDYCIGVSAGSANISSYLSGQRGRNYTFYMEYAFRKRYMSARNFVRTGSYIDMDYIYGELSNSRGENPLDYEALMRSRAAFKVVALNAHTGETVYFDKSDLMRDDYGIMKASSSIPIICKPYEVGGVPFYDGGIADPVPLARALADGCERIVLILTRPVDVLRTPNRDAAFTRILRRKYPMAAKHLALRHEKYNEAVAHARALEQAGVVTILAPDDIAGLGTLTKNKE
ncbi:MAG: patatin-like phospholipase family protein, partial [Christensenellales bacterium]